MMDKGWRRWEGVPGVVYPTEQPVLPEHAPAGWVSCREAARLLGCCKERARAALAGTGVRTRRGDFFPPEALAAAGRLLAPPPGWMSAAEARLQFGVSGRALCEWRGRGAVRSLPGRGRRGAFCYWYCGEDLAKACGMESGSQEKNQKND